MSFIQAETTGQTGAHNVPQPSISIPFDDDNGEDNIIVAIVGWENSGPDSSRFKDSNNNDYIALPIQTSATHRSQVLICPACAKGPNALELDFPSTGGSDPSITMAEYPAGKVFGTMPSAIGSSVMADAGPISIPSLATIIQLTDATQDAFASANPAKFTLRTPDGTTGPMRQAIIDGDFPAGSYTPQTTVVASAPWATTVLAILTQQGIRSLGIGIQNKLSVAGIDISLLLLTATGVSVSPQS